MKDLKFNTTTFGCKINLYESESIIESLVSKKIELPSGQDTEKL